MSWRNITVNGIKYKWMFGKSNIAVKQEGERRTYHVNFSVLTGIDWHNIERAIYKRSFTISPKEVAHYIHCVIQEKEQFKPIHYEQTVSRLTKELEAKRKLIKSINWYDE